MTGRAFLCLSHTWAKAEKAKPDKSNNKKTAKQNKKVQDSLLNKREKFADKVVPIKESSKNKKVNVSNDDTLEEHSSKKENLDKTDELDETLSDNKKASSIKVKDTVNTNANKNKSRLVKKQEEIEDSKFVIKKKIVMQWNYTDFNIEPPQNINYSTYKKDWCRYCGARFASQFNTGPWGARTLCVSHYEKLRKGQITVKGDEKTFPLKLSENTELGYLNKRREKNEKLKADEVLPPKKKLKTIATVNNERASETSSQKFV